MQSALTSFDGICRDISARCSGLTADQLCGGPINLPRCWRVDCEERPGGASSGNPSSELLPAGYLGRISLTRESPMELARFTETASSSTREACVESSGVCGVRDASGLADVVVPISQGTGRQQEGKEAQEHGEARQQAVKKATIVCAREVAAGSAAIRRGGIDRSDDGGDFCESNDSTAQMQPDGDFVGNHHGLTASATGKALPEQDPQFRPLMGKVQPGGEKVGYGLDGVLDQGRREPAEPEVKLCDGLTVTREISLGVGGPESRYTTAEGTGVTVKSDMVVRGNADDRSLETTVGGGENKNAAGKESNSESLLPPPVDVDEADDLTYSDLEDESLEEAPEKDTCISGEPIISSYSSSSLSAIAIKGRSEALVSMQGDTDLPEARGRVDVDVGGRRESHDLKSAPPYEASPHASGGEGENLPQPSGIRVREEDAANFVRPESGDVCRDDTVGISGASRAATEMDGLPREQDTAIGGEPGGAAVLGEAFGGEGSAAPSLGLTVEDGGVPRESCSLGHGDGGSRGAKQTNLSGPLSLSVDSSFEVTPLRGEIISDAFAVDTGATAASIANPDDVILAAMALLSESPSEADGNKTRVDHLGQRARETVGIPGDMRRIGVESVASISMERFHERHLERALLAPEGSLQRTKGGSLSSRPGVALVESGKSPRTVLAASPEQYTRGLGGMRREEQPRSTAIIEGILGRKVRNVADMSTLELEEELMWIRAMLASRSHV